MIFLVNWSVTDKFEGLSVDADEKGDRVLCALRNSLGVAGDC